MAKFFVPLIKRSFSTNFRQFLENCFWLKSTAADLTKKVKILYYLKMKNIFWQNSLFHSSKEVFLQTFRQFLENWIFDWKSTAADLTKMVKICTISKCAKKIFFDKILCSTQQKKCFYKLLGSCCKIEFLMENPQPRTLQKWRKFVLSKCAKKIFFWQNSLFHSSKEVFLQTFRQFLENWIFDVKSTAADLTKLVKILYYLKCAKKIFFGKILCSTQQKECFYKLLGSFWKIEFLTENRQPRPYKNGENFVLSQNVLRKHSLAKFFIPPSKRSVSTNF